MVHYKTYETYEDLCHITSNYHCWSSFSDFPDALNSLPRLTHRKNLNPVILNTQGHHLGFYIEDISILYVPWLDTLVCS